MLTTALDEAQQAAREARHEDVVALCEAAATDLTGASPAVVGELEFLRADALRHLGRWADAEAAFTRVVELEGEAEVHRRACRAWRLLSDIARRSRRFEESLRCARAAAQAAEGLDDPVGQLFSLVALARCCTDRGRGDEAAALIDRVMQQAERHLSDADRALVVVAARTVLSLLDFRRHDLPEAQAGLLAVRDEAAAVPHAVTRAAYHRQLAILYEVQHHYSAAIRHLNHALDLYDEVRFEPGRYDVYWSLARSFTDLGDLRTARLCLEQCQAIASRLDLRLELGKSKSSFGELAVREGDYAAAAALFREDLEISRGLGDQQALGHCNRKLADCYRLVGDYAAADAHAADSIASFEATGRASEANDVRVLRTRILVEAGRVADAAAQLAEAREQTRPAARAADRAALLRAEALVQRASGRLDLAARAFDESLALLDRGQLTRDVASTQFEAGLNARDRGDAPAAVGYLRQSVDIAGLLGSRDLWQQAVDELWQLDLIEGQRMMLKPYLPGRAVDELRTGEAPGRLATATVMFADMRGATELSGTLSPLDLSEVVSAFLGPVVRIILRWGGSVDKFIGDCVMAVFGMHEAGDGAEEATRAGIEIIEYMEATKQIRRRTGASVLEATIGLNTGEVVAGCFGPLLRRDYTVLGYHVNLAQRLQSAAGSVPSELGTRMVISESTRAGLRTEVPVDRVDLRTVTLKGIDTEVVEAWLVCGPEAIAAVE